MQKKRLLWQIPFLLLLIAGTVWVIKNQHETAYLTNEGFVFGTSYKITYQYDKDLKTGIEAELKKVDNALSMFNTASVISHINQGKHDIPDNETGKMFLDVYNLAQSISKETNGAFDITVAPLVNAWGFGFKSGEMPTKAQVDSIRQFVGYQKLAYYTERGGQGINKSDPRVMLDCSAIAKGYGCDVVAHYLEQQGILRSLPEKLREIAELRVENPELPLGELGQLLDPPVSKSGVNHRLKKLSETAEKERSANH